MDQAIPSVFQGAARTNMLSSTPSPVGVLLAGLKAARHQDDTTSSRSASPRNINRSSSPSLSPSEPRGRRLHRSTSRSMPLKPNQLAEDSGEGILLDAHQLVRDASVTLDVFKGSLVVLMVASNTIITMSSVHLRSHSFASLLICNAAASLCFVGFLMAFGWSCYGQYLLEWPDPVKELGQLRLRVLKAIACPVVGAWVCNFVWCFLCLKNPFTKANIFDVFTFSRVFGNGPDFLCSFSLNLALVYALWRPIMRLLNAATQADDTFGLVSRFGAQTRRDMAALAIALCPLLTTLKAVPDCTGNMRWFQWFFVCDKREIDTPSLPAIPHLMNFGIGILAAACWNRFLADLRPAGNGGPSGGACTLSLAALRRWIVAALATFFVLLVFFLPLGQVWMFTDLSVVQMSTPFGQLVRGFSDGPSMLWLLATLWPIAIWTGFIVVLVTLRNTALGFALHGPLGWLEHLGANVLYYLVVTDILLAGMFRGFSRNPVPFDLPTCIAFTAIIFAIGKFLHATSKSAEK